MKHWYWILLLFGPLGPWACSEPSQPRNIAARDGSFVLTNWRAIKLPIHVTLSTQDATVADRPDGSCDVTQGIRATVWDDNGRQIADSLGQWSSEKPAIATVDSLGFVTVQGCGAAPQVTWAMDSAGITFTLTNSK